MNKGWMTGMSMSESVERMIAELDACDDSAELSERFGEIVARLRARGDSAALDAFADAMLERGRARRISEQLDRHVKDLAERARSDTDARREVYADRVLAEIDRETEGSGSGRDH